VTATAGAPRLELYNPSGTLIASNAPISFTAAVTGAYRARLTGGGVYLLTIQPTGSLTAFDQWKASHGVPLNTPDDSDTDGDGIVLLLEYAHAGNPRTNDSTALLPVVGLTTPSSTRYLTLTYRQNTNAPDLAYHVEATGTVGSGWSTNGVVEISRIPNSGYDTVTARDGVPINSATQRFMRLRMIRP
jgi:hypothetical protein